MYLAYNQYEKGRNTLRPFLLSLHTNTYKLK